MDNQSEKKLAISNFKVHRTTYNNGISYKFDNRRATIINRGDDGFGFEFKSIDHNYTPHAMCECEKGKVAVTKLNLTKEASEIVLFALAEMMGFDVCKRKN